jgi:hypothetical protein
VVGNLLVEPARFYRCKRQSVVLARILALRAALLRAHRPIGLTS